MLLALFERGIGLVALELRNVPSRVVANARGQLNRVGQLHQVIARAEHEGFRLHFGLFFR